MPIVAVTDYTFPDLAIERSILAPHGIEVVASMERLQPAGTAGLVRDADAVITQFAIVNGSVIDAMGKAKAIVRYGIGYDNVDVAAARARGIPVCNIPDYCVDEVADHTMAFILAITRQVVANSRHVHEGRWGLACPLASMQALRNLAVGLVGFGRIGREVARRLIAFRARVLVFDPAVPPEAISATGAFPVASLDELLSQSDVVSPHCPSLPSTRRMFNASTFARMKAGAVFVNVGRGDLADGDALARALESGPVAAAALDVFDPEPIPAGHPILGMPNVILASHVASASPGAVRTLRETAARIALMAIRGEPLPNVVNTHA